MPINPSPNPHPPRTDAQRHAAQLMLATAIAIRHGITPNYALKAYVEPSAEPQDYWYALAEHVQSYLCLMSDISAFPEPEKEIYIEKASAMAAILQVPPEEFLRLINEGPHPARNPVSGKARTQ